MMNDVCERKAFRYQVWAATAQRQKGEFMQNQDNRVLSRTGARELTPEEVEYTTGAGLVQTQFCTALHTHGRFDGDGCGDNS
jgi:hypothetical protein